MTPKRDKFGRFVKSTSTKTVGGVKTKTETKGAVNILSKIFRTQEGKDDQTLVDIKITNPLHRIVQVLQEIKNHQATTVSLRFTIPLIALPIVILLAFQLGRAQTICSQSFVSKVGTVRSINIMAPKKEPDAFSILFSFFPSIPSLIKTSELTNQRRSLLITPQAETFTVVHDQTIDLLPYQNQTLILTGNTSECTHTITLDSIENLSPVSIR